MEDTVPYIVTPGAPVVRCGSRTYTIRKTSGSGYCVTYEDEGDDAIYYFDDVFETLRDAFWFISQQK